MPVPLRPGLLPRSLFLLYKSVLSPILHAVSPSQCKFLPTCSEYAYVAVARHGPLRGSVLTLRRLARCHPFTAGGFDPVPPSSSPMKEPAPEPGASKPLHLS